MNLIKTLKSFILCLFSLILLVSACNLGNKVKITNFNPKGEVQSQTTFTIEFSKDLATEDKIDQWTTEEYIEFEPKIHGKFKWVSANTLIFSPDRPLEPMQSYKADVTKKVLFNKPYSPDFDDIEFHTPDFDLKKVEYFWTNIPNQFYKLSVQANLHFNYPVNPEQLNQFIEVEREGNVVKDYQIITNGNSEVIALNFGEIQQSDIEQSLFIKVKKGLKSVIGKKPLAENKEFKEKLPPITQIEIRGVTSGFDGAFGWIEVATTQKVDEKRLKDFVTINPAKDLQFFVDENKFRIQTDLSEFNSVKLNIKKGMPGLYGGILEEDYDQDVVMANISPSIRFADSRGKYLMLGGEKNIKVNVVNLDEVEVEVSHIFKNNILYFLAQNFWGNNSEYEEYYYYPSNNDVGDFGKPLYNKKYQMKNNQNWLESFTINLDTVLKLNTKGIYVVDVHSTNDRWQSDSKVVSISDLAIIAKKSQNEILLFVNSIKTTEPVSEVEITVISTNNQTLFSGKTDSKGVIRFPDFGAKSAGFTARVITAEKDGDFNYIDLRETEIETSRFDVGGMYEFSPDFSAFIYSDRNIYRPGETAYLSVIVRDSKIKLIKDLPVLFKILNPTGRTFNEYRKTLNEEGSIEVSANIPGYAQTGQYVAELYAAGKLIGSYNFSVEDFVPDKIRVLLNSDKSKANPGDVVNIGIDAEFLFGAKAAGMKWEGEVVLRHKPYKSSRYPDYDFSNSYIINEKNGEKADDIANSRENLNPENNFKVDGSLDENGKANIQYPVPGTITSGGIISAKAYISVFDLTGRTVNRVSGFDIYPNKYFIGIKQAGYYYGVNQNITFKIAGVDDNDNPMKSMTCTAKLIRYEWKTVLKKDYGTHYYYSSERVAIPESEKDFNINNGVKDFSFAVSKSGKYELRISKKGANVYQKVEFWAWGWGSSTASSFEVDKEGRVDIVLDKQVYQPGDKAKVLFTCPFSGKMLVTIERNGVYDYQYINVENKSASMNIPVSDDYMPNVYITATLFKKHNIDQTTPFLAGHGFISMKVENKRNKLPVTINAPKKIKPNTTQKITVKTASEKNIFVTLAAVDEGILQVKNFKTPDPYSFMYAKRGLKTESYDLYKLLLPEIIAGHSSPGGSEDMFGTESRKRANPISTKRYNLLAIWSGILKTNSSGIVQVPLKIPQFNGEVRLMVVAYQGSRFGSGEESIKIADDIILEPEIPRFLTMDDSLVAPVTLINTTNKQGNVKVNLKTEGPIKVTSNMSESVIVPANATKQVIFAMKTEKYIGEGKISFETSGMAKIREEINIAVRPSSPYTAETGAGSIRAGGEINIKMPANFVWGTQNMSLTISKFPAVKFADQLKYLVSYPYGCLEQTVSVCFPQLYFAELAKSVAPKMYKANNPVSYIKEGIHKIESMQRYDGSVSYWPGFDHYNWWSSVYAAHFLVEAKNAGYKVNEAGLNRLLDFLQKLARRQNLKEVTYEYVSWDMPKKKVTNIARKEIAYSLYVLALAGRGDISTMNYYKARPNMLSLDSKYLIAGSYALMGQWNAYYSALPQLFKPEINERHSGGDFDSEIRSNALILNVLMEVEPNNKNVGYIINYLSQNIKKCYSTQERAFAFLALGKAAKRTLGGNVKVDIWVDGKKADSYSGNDLTVAGSKLNSGKVTLKAYGTGEVYYFWSAEGVKWGEKVKENDQFMKVRRSFFDYRTRKEIKDNQFTQGQLLVCKISLTGYERSADNIVITDMIPAGFEIENPRLNTTKEIYWKNPEPIYPQYMDVRDDRLLLFTDLNGRKTKEFYYLCRVVNQGRFQLPAIAADAMYSPEYHSINGAGIVRVHGIKEYVMR